MQIWPAVAERAIDMSELDLENEVELFEGKGQRLPVVVRPIADGRFEAVLHSELVTVAKKRNADAAGTPLELEVEIVDMDDAEAYRRAAQDLDGGPDVSSLAKASFFKEVLKAYSSQKAAATVCRVSESSLSKTLDVGRAAHILQDKVLIPRDISQRDASWLMELYGRDRKTPPENQTENRAVIKATLQVMVPNLSKSVFSVLRAAFKTPTEPKGRRALTHDGTPVGHLTQKKKGGMVTISLNEVGGIEPDVLGQLISAAIAEARREAL